ncbi:Ubiquinone/menaquinone biosynthesis C-methylase UbiE [Streptomyces sp. WMMB 714]|uniref:class I SAM-dependent methyltransferase n=1 Tax=Streptomyces sp. WMMB 714 TaxID=1286822 RepID=UPI0005F7AE28|nr:class I SAM-dependent methyltransferase [Streptomyces sp. WMMB 714]SCK15075.1 Ubiquinone/menaquinone biosynthesis C-methylase UbiE [Streptomyces sp. WMMB 714]
MGTGTHAGHGHGHAEGHGHGEEDIDWEAMADYIEQEGEMRIPFAEEAAAWLRGLLLEGGCGPEIARRLLDVGSGPGVYTALLAREFPQAEVVAVDGTPALLERARVRAEHEGVGSRVTTLEAQLPEDFGRLGSADVIWTSHVVHHIGDQQAALDALAASLRPGGLLAVVERGLAPRYLPRDLGFGRPGLPARLEALTEDWFSAMRADLPDHTRSVEDWPAMLARAGLTPAGTRSFLTELPAPLGKAARSHLHAKLSRERASFEEELDDEDRRTLDALLDEEAPTGIMHRPDAFYLTATTVHTGRAS